MDCILHTEQEYPLGLNRGHQAAPIHFAILKERLITPLYQVSCHKSVASLISVWQLNYSLLDTFKYMYNISLLDFTMLIFVCSDTCG